MQIKEFDKRVNKAIEQYRTDLRKRINKAYQDHDVDRVKRLKAELESGSPFALTFKSRRRVFENYKASCVLDLINETGHSYTWWCMFKRINGKLCLNTYRYSHCTSRHINYAAQVLGLLGIKYLSIEAPKGLQDLDAAVRHAAYVMGKALVAKKYARKHGSTKYAETLIKNLNKIGLKVPKSLITEMTKRAEESRRAKLERNKQRRIEIAGSLLQLAIDERMKRDQRQVSNVGN